MKEYFSGKGRIRRSEYIYIMVTVCTLLFVGIFVLQKELEDQYYVLGAFDLLYFLIGISLLWAALAAGAKRCHDLGKSGYYQLIPFYMLWMMIAEGENKKNQYGFPPKMRLSQAHWKSQSAWLEKSE